MRERLKKWWCYLTNHRDHMILEEYSRTKCLRTVLIVAGRAYPIPHIHVRIYCKHRCNNCGHVESGVLTQNSWPEITV